MKAFSLPLLFAAFLLLADAFHASPTSLRRSSAHSGDPELSQSQQELEKAITCLSDDVGQAVGGIVLLLHGTGATGDQTWLHGPYTEILPKLSPGFDVCYLNFPNRSLSDAQVTAEYIVHATRSLAPRSATRKISIIGHSQGAGVNPQWAMAFWPSIRSMINAFVALSGDFRGTLGSVSDMGFPLHNSSILSPALYQQIASSHYMAAQNRVAPGALIQNTTSIYSKYDEIVPYTSSSLDGAANFLLQDLCGPALIVDHYLQVVEMSTFALAYDALLHGRADARRFRTRFCSTYPDGSHKKLVDALPYFHNIVAETTAIVLIHKSPGEPLLKPYVCANRDSSTPAAYCAKSGYFP
ncbi:hypothetical protein OC846_000314 [Tilletia horrida]|uniref:Alpha/beta-hydrolase n=1 Tax=Tilletia horrida TaxID=155126 RepID=A0AAN6GXC1_9BASI|nr:hypothetical protein OC846_000314 [Tilletia horrida]KAK0570279.1 hypothetical protein OC861_000022 [Tilletia horrida]